MLHQSRDHEHHSPDELGSQNPNHNTRPARPSSPLKFFASSSPPKPIDRRESQKAWTANYLADLRSNRPARPSGSRPLVQRNPCSSPPPVLEPTLRPTSALAFSRPPGSTHKNDSDRPDAPNRCSSAMSHRRSNSALLTIFDASHAGESLVQQPHPGVSSRDFSSSTISTSTSQTPLAGVYVERAQRRVEKQEARLLREALEEVDLRDDVRLHAAAQDEASDLVWKHQNPGIRFSDPKISRNPGAHRKPDDNMENQHLKHTLFRPASRDHIPGNRSATERSASVKSTNSGSQCSRVSSTSSTDGGKDGDRANQTASAKGPESQASPQKKAYVNLNFSTPQIKSFGHRRVSGPKSRKPSGGLFSNPDDKIYEEPEAVKNDGHRVPDQECPVPAPLKLRARNSVAKLQGASYGFLRSKTVPEVEQKKPFRTEIHRNPPSQSRNPTYVQNLPKLDLSEKEMSISEETPKNTSRNKEGFEIRGEDIRAATSMRMKDRSPKLPSPTVVSDKPRRPIVSFDRDWKPKDSVPQPGQPSTQNGQRPLPTILRSKSMAPESTNSAPAIPTINAPDPPSIQVNDSPIPSINVSSASSVSVSPIPSISVNGPDVPNISVSISDAPKPSGPQPTNSNSPRPSPFKRPLPHHSSTAPVSTSTPHWSPSSHNRPTAQCAACALPIAGRIVSAASQRFHPHCFTCCQCGELLECVAFYPEPTAHRESRLARIEIRATDLNAPDNIDGLTALDDGDSSLRFYCHLDFHELFSPRCRSCKTPIEGEIVLACGGEWHKGHFFCAQCGDPFDEKTPFVEKDGYAWCVGCHAGRFNGKCKGCRKVILEQGVQALGGEWHEGCFCCVVSLVFSSGRGLRDMADVERRSVVVALEMADSSREGMMRSRFAWDARKGG